MLKMLKIIFGDHRKHILIANAIKYYEASIIGATKFLYKFNFTLIQFSFIIRYVRFIVYIS